MNMTKVSCLPLTPDDMITLRGKPVAKLIKPSKGRNLSLDHQEQEWIYVSPHTMAEEHYFFKEGYLVGWKKTSI